TWSKDNAPTLLASESADFCIWVDQFRLLSSKTSPSFATLVHFSELHRDNRELILSTQWQSETLIKRLWMKSKQRPNPSQSKAKSFWNPTSLSVNYARLKNGSSPSLKPFGKQPVKQAGEIPF